MSVFQPSTWEENGSSNRPAPTIHGVNNQIKGNQTRKRDIMYNFSIVNMLWLCLLLFVHNFDSSCDIIRHMESKRSDVWHALFNERNVLYSSRISTAAPTYLRFLRLTSLPVNNYQFYCYNYAGFCLF